MENSRVSNVTSRALTGLRTWRIVRVAGLYLQKHGELLAGGMSVAALFSVFAALYLAFAIAGLYLQGTPEIRDQLVALLNNSAPGLIDTGKGGAINLDELFAARILGWSGVVAAVILTVTAVSWMTATRDAVRQMFGLPRSKTFFLLLKLKDLGLTVGFGIAMVVSATLSVLSTSALTFVLSLLGIGGESPILRYTIRVAVLLIVLVLDTAVLAMLFRLLSAVLIPWRRLLAGCFGGAVTLGILKVLGSSLLVGVSRNPLLTSFAVIFGLLIWFSLICRVILLSAAWIAVDMSDHGLTGHR